LGIDFPLALFFTVPFTIPPKAKDKIKGKVTRDRRNIIFALDS
jgi:hypothetical protein